MHRALRSRTRLLWAGAFLAALFPLQARAGPLPPAQTQPEQAEPAIFSLSLTVRAAELRFRIEPSLSIRDPLDPNTSLLRDECQFQSGVTYRNITIRLQVDGRHALLTCGSAGAGEEPAGAQAAEPMPSGEPN